MIQRWLLVALLLGQPAMAEQQAELPGAALFTEANRHHSGDGVLQNFATAAALFEQAAAQGHAGAQNQLGQYFHSGLGGGLGGAQNQKAALRWLRAAAEQGDPRHIFDLGKALEQGADGSQDATSAAKAYQQAADLGHADAAVSLGVLYQNGTGVAQNYTRALELYQGPAAEGHARAQNNLGLLYVRGTGVTLDYIRAATLFAEAAEQGLPTAMTNLSVMYGNGFGVEQSDAQAADWERRASQQRQQGPLGTATEAPLCSFDPRLTPPAKDPNASALRHRAAEGGDPVAQFLRGWQLCSRTPASAGDLRQAGIWFKAAAAKGHGPSMTNLGWLYLRGRGVPQDYVLGYMWLTLAQSVGQPLALEDSAALRQQMTAAQINEAQQRATVIWQEIRNR
ncbi:MAG: hypothetical protein COB16_11560 [Rhodobacteraceae bacterium]|nr:MAG: hypothetical protein COB16_11560 [Paracoccaceae bacterium]